MLGKIIYSKNLPMGKVDGYHNGIKNCPLVIEIEIRQQDRQGKLTVGLEPISSYLELSICGEVWNHQKTDIVAGGQMYDSLADYLPLDKNLIEIIRIWKRWHLNGLQAGSRKQTEVVDAYKQDNPTWRYDYTEACEILRARGLYEDTSKLGRLERVVNRLFKQGKGYKYGTAWLIEPLPDEIVEQVKSW